MGMEAMSEEVLHAILALAGLYIFVAGGLACVFHVGARDHRLSNKKRKEYARRFFMAPAWPVIGIIDGYRAVMEMRETAK